MALRVLLIVSALNVRTASLWLELLSGPAPCSSLQCPHNVCAGPRVENVLGQMLGFLFCFWFFFDDLSNILIRLEQGSSSRIMLESLMLEERKITMYHI